MTHLVDTYPAVLADDPGTGWRATIDELRDAKADAVPGILLRAWPLSASAMITALATMLGVEPPGRLQ